MSEASKLKKALAEDDTYLRFRNIVRTIQKRINVEKNLIEARSLHGARTVRTLKGTAPSATALYEATVREAATRARLTEIKITLYVEEQLLKASLDATISHLRTAYDLSFVGNTQEDRKLVVRSILRSGYKLHDELTSAINILDLIVKDIDQAGYSTRNLIDIVKIQTERPGQTI